MKWYQIKTRTIKAADEKSKDKVVADVDLLDEIGYWGITGKDFLTELRSKAKDADEINLSINSPGGSVFDGLAMFNGLTSLNKPINVKVLGIAASAASLVAMAGTHISMPENTFMMIHNPWGVAVGNADEMRDTADILDKIGNSLLATYVKRTGAKEEDVRAWLATDTYMTAKEAKERGFADEVTEPVSAKASFDTEQLPQALREAFLKAQIKPEPNVDLSVVATIEKKATDAGFPEFAAAWALDPEIADANDPVKAVEARIEAAREVKALCALVKKPDVANAFISQKTPIKTVRAKLQDAAASADERLDIDAHLKITKPVAQQQQPQAATPDLALSIWQRRNEQFAK